MAKLYRVKDESTVGYYKPVGADVEWHTATVMPGVLFISHSKVTPESLIPKSKMISGKIIGIEQKMLIEKDKLELVSDDEELLKMLYG